LDANRRSDCGGRYRHWYAEMNWPTEAAQRKTPPDVGSKGGAKKEKSLVDEHMQLGNCWRTLATIRVSWCGNYDLIA
jgi:hypothetical protein